MERCLYHSVDIHLHQMFGFVEINSYYCFASSSQSLKSNCDQATSVGYFATFIFCVFVSISLLRYYIGES